MSQRRNRKKKIHRHLVQESTPVVSISTEAPIATTIEPVATVPVQAKVQSGVSVVDSRQMRRDLLKVVVVLAVITLILLAIDYTNHSYGWLGQAGNHLYTWLRLG